MEDMRHRGRLVTLLGACALVIAFLAIVIGWRHAQTEYRLWRLERAEIREEAFEILEEIARSAASSPSVAEQFAGRLGEARPRTTFWSFAYWTHEPDRGPSRLMIPEHLGRMLPILRAFSQRAVRSEELLRCWNQFSFWSGIHDDLKEILDPPRKTVGGLLLEGLIGHIGQAIAKGLETEFREECVHHPDRAEGLARLFWIKQAGIEWYLGMEPGKEFPSKLLETEAVTNTWKSQVTAWLKEKEHHLRYDPERGRYVLTQDLVLKPVDLPPHPDSPLPGWNGPIPQMEEWKNR